MHSNIGTTLNQIESNLIELLESLVFPAQILLCIVVSVALIVLVRSIVNATLKNCTNWKPAPNGDLMYSYFCGTGNHQLKLIFRDAKKMLFDRRTFLISFAGSAHNLGNMSSKSKIIMFFGSVLYLPLMIIGAAEMLVRFTLCFAILILLSFIAFVFFILSGIIIRLLIPLFRAIDHALRVEQHCPVCYSKFRLPDFKCPHCGKVHKNLIPGPCGVFTAMCSCGHFIPTSVISRRSRLDALCPNPKCQVELNTSNAKQFFIQVIGGKYSGKTAFLAAFQHQYLNHSKIAGISSISGEPRTAFYELEQMCIKGYTQPSSDYEIISYNYIHKLKNSSERSMIFYDVPGEMILGDGYEKSPLNFGYTNGIIIVIDPLSVPSLRSECIRRCELSSAVDFSNDNSESTIVEFINKFSEIAGRAARKMSDIPVAVVISKCDIKSIKSRIGLPKIKVQYNKDPEKYNNDLSVARDTICREFLNDIGLSNVINNLESVFSEVSYFPTSAIGHTPEANIKFEPFGIIAPLAWITQKRDSTINQALKYVQEATNSSDNAEQN